MKYLKNYDLFSENKKVEYVGTADKNVEIRIDVEAVSHALDMQYRHGLDKLISKSDILNTIEMAIEELTIALMQNKFNIYQEEDYYPNKEVKKGEPNRFVIENKKSNLNIVCTLKPGEDNFTLTVITVMRHHDFKTRKGQFVVKV